MAKPSFYTDYRCEESGDDGVYLEFTATTGGAVDEIVRGSRAIESVEDDTTGKYVVTFRQAWVALMSAIGYVVPALTYSKTTACNVRIIDDSGITDPDDRTVVLGITDGDGDLIDLADGDVVKVRFFLQWNDASARGVNV